jgi:benzoylformate decarboxylase
MDLRLPHSYFFPASGGLGFGVGGAVGVQLAMPERPVVAIIGDGSMNYTIAGLWTAARLNLPILYVVLRNGTYQALREFAHLLKTGDAPYLSIPGIDFTAIARGYGVTAVHIDDLQTLNRMAWRRDTGPLLIELDTVSN